MNILNRIFVLVDFRAEYRDYVGAMTGIKCNFFIKYDKNMYQAK